jgi:hypothetical protein
MTLEKPRRGDPCSVATFIQELAEKNPAEHDLFVERLYAKNPRGWVYSGAALWKQTRDERKLHGYETVVAQQTVNRHRSDQCRCADRS